MDEKYKVPTMPSISRVVVVVQVIAGLRIEMSQVQTSTKSWVFPLSILQ